uniref:RanBD1 domain-containing protein n=1 Tax=Rodentolepis nana TaxID=102285 RepID=A0A0R3TYE2_RODNA
LKALIRREFQTSRCNELKARTKEKQWTVGNEIKARTKEKHNFGQESKPLLSLDYVPDGLPGKTPSKIGSIQSRCNELKARTKENPTGQESKPLLSLDYAPDTTAWQNIFTDWEHTLNPRENGEDPPDSVFKGGNGEDPPDSVSSGGNGDDPPDSVSSSKDNGTEKTHLIRCPALETRNPHAPYVTYRRKWTPDSVSSSKDKDGKPETLGSKKTANELQFINCYIGTPTIGEAEVKVYGLMIIS